MICAQVDTCASFWDCNFSISDFTEGVLFWTRWLREATGADATMIVNLRDLAKGMLRCPDRCVAMVVAMAELPRDVRPAALLFEEPFGKGHNTFGVDLGDKVRDAVRKSFDLDGDRDVEWDEYKVWLVWALRSTQDAIHSVDDLFSAVVRRGIMPGLMASS